MSKPLNLAIFERSRCSCPCQEPFWIDPRDGSQRQRHHFNADPLVACSDYDPEKRLRDEELAADVFRQAAWLGAIGRTHAADAGRNIFIEAAFTFGPITRDEYEWLTLHRFATLPHYDEVAS